MSVAHPPYLRVVPHPDQDPDSFPWLNDGIAQIADALAAHRAARAATSQTTHADLLEHNAALVARERKARRQAGLYLSAGAAWRQRIKSGQAAQKIYDDAMREARAKNKDRKLAIGAHKTEKARLKLRIKNARNEVLEKIAQEEKLVRANHAADMDGLGLFNPFAKWGARRRLSKELNRLRKQKSGGKLRKAVRAHRGILKTEMAAHKKDHKRADKHARRDIGDTRDNALRTQRESLERSRQTHQREARLRRDHYREIHETHFGPDNRVKGPAALRIEAKAARAADRARNMRANLMRPVHMPNPKF